MLWVVYNTTKPAQIIQKFYSKKSAKEFVANTRRLKSTHWLHKHMSIEKIDIVRMDEWIMWKTLQAGE
jgi:hypothetical protein